jgi:rhamnogalacturonyl hydrolase YesR
LFAQLTSDLPAFKPDSILKKMYRVNENFNRYAWKQNDRNWIRGTYYTGLMEFYHVTTDEKLLNQAKSWAAKHGYRTGAEWTYPPNRLTCTQTYLDLYFIDKNEHYIIKTKSFMDKRVYGTESAEEQGWWYVDALYVGIPAYIKMSMATSDEVYSNYADKMFWEVKDSLYDNNENLFYRDKKAKSAITENGRKEIWSRGNGWAIASIPKILNHLPQDHSSRKKYKELLGKMAKALSKCQRADGFWNTNLSDPEQFPGPESSGTAFFVYAISYGINHHILDENTFLPVVLQAWKALYKAVDENGKVCWGQAVSRDPGKVDKEDSAEFVAGAFLLAGSEIYKLFSINALDDKEAPDE